MSAPAARIALLQATAIGPLRQSVARTLLAIVAIALGVALGFAVYLINRVAADEVQGAARALFGMADLSVQGSGQGFDEMLLPTVASLPGVQDFSPVVEVRARLPGHERPLLLVGIDPFRAARMQPVLGATAGQSARSSGLLAENAVWLSAAAARGLQLTVGALLDVQVGLGVVQLRVAGILPATDYREPIGLLDIAAAQLLLQRLGSVDRIDLRVAPGTDIAQLRRRLQALLPAGVTVTTPGEAGDEAVRLTRAYRSNLTALALVALFTGAFLVHATQSLAVARRRREIAFLHALGMTEREQLVAALIGGGSVGALGAAFGILLGLLIARTGLAAFGADLGAGYFRGVAPPLQVSIGECLVFFMLGVAAALAATLGPAHEAAAVPAAAALKAGDEAPLAVRSHAVFALVLIMLSAASLALPPWQGIPLPGYAAIAGLLLAAVLLTPAVATRFFGRLPARGSAWQQVAIAQLRGTARSAITSVAAVLVSFSLMVAMAIMVHSFRSSLDDWMQRVLPADLYLRVGLLGQSAFIDAATQARLRALPGMTRVDFVRFQQVTLAADAQPITVIARPVDEASAGKLLQLRSVANAPAAPGTVPVWISEAAADLHGWQPRAQFDLPLGGKSLRAEVRGTWRDYERPAGSLILDQHVYRNATGDDRVTSAGFWLAPGVDIDTASVRLQQTLGSAVQSDIAVPREIRRRSLAMFDRTFAVTYLLEAVAVLIGLFGISASMSSQVLARRAEFGMLRHLGVTRGEVQRVLALEGAALGALGVLCGLLVGFVISLILIYVVNRQSFHWSMDLHVPWQLLATLSAVLVIAAALTAAISGRKVMGNDVVRAVKEDW
jgi:putative ABC transport system permease protein